MKNHALRIGIATLTFIAGITVTSLWFSYRVPPASIPPVPISTTVTQSPKANIETGGLPIAFCDLVRHPKLYDQKIVRVLAVYVTGIDSATLHNPSCDWDRDDAWVQARCSPTESCGKVDDALKRLLPGQRGFIRAKLDVVGRFYAFGEESRHRLLMLDVKDAKPIESGARQYSEPSNKSINRTRN
jgi:hypothetical protein